MFFNKTLFLWQFRRVQWITLIALIVALYYVLFEPRLCLFAYSAEMLWFTLIHSFLIVWQLGRVRRPSFGFLYTQGYSRDAIWWHTMLASAASVLAVWLPASLLFWTGLRSMVQEAMQNYNFPVMSPLEQTYPFWGLLFYFLFLLAFHYAWIRHAQPTRGTMAGVFVAISVVFAVFSIGNAVRIPMMSGVAQELIFLGLITTAITLLIGGWRLHRYVEVTSFAFFGTKHTHADRPAGLAARVTETLALGGISLATLVMITMHGYFWKPRYELNDMTPPGMLVHWGIMAILSLAVLALLLVAWFRRTSLACVMLATFFFVVNLAILWEYTLSYKNRVNEILAMPVPIDITVNNNLPGAKVWFNNVYLGETPIRIDVDELLQKVPPLEKPPEEWSDSKKYYFDKYKNAFYPVASITLESPPVIPDASWAEKRPPGRRDFYVRVELDGERMYWRPGYNRTNFYPSSPGSRRYGKIEPGYVWLNMILPTWEEEIEQLIERARLADYQIDDAWIASAESYGGRVWEVIREKLQTDEELSHRRDAWSSCPNVREAYRQERDSRWNQVLDTWATRRYKLDGARGPDSARDVFKHIVAEAEKQGYYDTDSPMGRAIELIVPYLDAEPFVEKAETRLASFTSCRDLFDLSDKKYGVIGGRPYFATRPRPRRTPSKPNVITPADAVLAHVLWKLDERLDREDDKHDNLIEQRIVPLILRMNPGNQVMEISLLGGSIFEKYDKHLNPGKYSILQKEEFEPWPDKNSTEDSNRRKKPLPIEM